MSRIAFGGYVARVTHFPWKPDLFMIRAVMLQVRRVARETGRSTVKVRNGVFPYLPK